MGTDVTFSSGRELGRLPYWLIVASLLVLGVLSLPSIGWLLIALAILLALLGAMRSHRAIIVPVGAGLLGLVVAYLLFAPGLCVEGSAGGAAGGTGPTCRSLASIPLGGENWIPFLILGPILAMVVATFVRRSMSLPGDRSGDLGGGPAT